MTKKRYLSQFIYALLLIFGVFSWANDDLRSGSLPGNSDRAFADLDLQFNVTTITGSEVVLGVEVLDGIYHMTAGGLVISTEPENYFYRMTSTGSLLTAVTQPTISEWGWRDLATDGAFLYGSDSAVIDQIDPVTGLKTGITIPSPVDPARGIAYNPTSDTFYVVNFTSSLFEIDRLGNVINTFPNTHWAYGLAYDDVTPGGPYLWMNHQDINSDVLQIVAATGVETGLGFNTSANVGAAGGATVVGNLLVNKLSLVAVEQAGTEDYVNVFDLDVFVPIEVPTMKSWLFIFFAILLASFAIVRMRKTRTQQ